MKVEEIMTREPRSCRVHDTLESACRAMWDCDCGAVPIVDAESRVIAMLTDRDACMAALHQRKALHELPISVPMSKTVWSVHPEDTVEHAEDVMKERQVRRLPVTDFGGRLVGIISLNDIAREAARERPQKISGLMESGVAETLAAIGEPQHPISRSHRAG